MSRPVSFEIIRALIRIATQRLGGIALAPVLGAQLLSTRRPDDSQIEVAIAALDAARQGDGVVVRSGGGTLMAEPEMSAFEQRLAALEARYVELEELLSAPDAYQDLERVQNLSREQAKLREVVEAARRWREAQEAGP